MESTAYTAGRVLEALWGFGFVVAYVAYRGVVLPRVFEHSNDPPPSLLDETEPERSDAVRGGQLVFAGLAMMCFFFFLNVAGGDIWVVMRGAPAWGVLAVLICVGTVGQVVMVEWLHRQDNRYTDLLSDADAKASALSIARYRYVAKMARMVMAAWVTLFVVAVFWLWEIGR